MIGCLLNDPPAVKGLVKIVQPYLRGNRTAEIFYHEKPPFCLSFPLGGSAILHFPVKGGLAHAQPFHGLDGSEFTAPPPGTHLVKIRMDNGFPSLILPLTPGQLNSLPLALEEVFPLQLGHRAEHGEHELAGGGGGVDGLFLRDKLHPFGVELSHQLQEIAGIAGKTADRLHDHCIPLANKGHHLLEPGAVRTFPAHLVEVDLFHAQRLHQHLLAERILFPGADPDVSDFHVLSGSPFDMIYDLLLIY